MTTKLSQGVAHKMPADLRQALTASTTTRTIWESLTPLARNEWICWTISVKKPKTCAEHVAHVVIQLNQGKRRPCCWARCLHRTDNVPSPSQKVITHIT